MKTFTKTKDSEIRANLRTWRSLASPKEVSAGSTWYDEANSIASNIERNSGVSVFNAAAVLAALSPSNKWERNILDAQNLCEAWSTGRSADSVRCCTYNANKAKAWRILEGDQGVLDKSPKVWAFANTITWRNKASCVVIDRWHARACLTRSKRRKVVQENLTLPQYNRVERLTIEEAMKANEAPCVYQAIIWCTIKNNWEK